jgi:hypothetical protein
MAGTDDDDTTPEKKLKLPAGFAEKFKVPPDVARQIKSLTHPERMPPSLTPEVQRAIDLLNRKRKERIAVDEMIRITRRWLLARGVDPKLWAEPTSAAPSEDQQGNPTPEPGVEPALGETVMPTKTWPAQPAQDEIDVATRKLWPPDGIVPPEFGPADLRHAIEELYKREWEPQKREAMAKKEKPPELPEAPSWNSCDRFLEKQRGPAA